MTARGWCVLLSLCLLTLASGAARCAGEPAATKATPVEVVLPVAREVSDYEDFAGRLEPAASVRLKARVSGYVDRSAFAEGGRVKRGDVLFEIDPRPYKAELQKAQAGVTLAATRVKKAEIDFKRTADLAAKKVVSTNELGRLAADREAAQAQLAVAKAVQDIAALNLSFTSVHAPIDGRIGQRQLDVGGLARADETTLATLTAEGPLYAYFDIDERTYLRLRVAAGKEGGKAPRVAVGLANEAGFPRQAEASLLDNAIDPNKGTIRLRATLPNADGTLVPGLSARVRLTTGKPYKALLVPATEARTARGGRGPGAARASLPRKAVLLVVNAKDEVEERAVVLGSRHGSLVAVREGLKDGDRVILGGQTWPIPGEKVVPKLMPAIKE